MGCKRIAHISGLPFTTGVRRLAGYKAALEEGGLKFDPSLVSPFMTVDGRDWEQSHGAMQLLLKNKRPDGVFCYNDPIAIAAIDAALEAGLRIPEEMAFIGCDNLHYDSSLKIPLSGIWTTRAVRSECARPRSCCRFCKIRQQSGCEALCWSRR